MVHGGDKGPWQRYTMERRKSIKDVTEGDLQL